MTEQNIKLLFRYRFGNADFDEARFELRVAGLIVDVERKPLEVLAMLLTHAGEVVTKEELLERIWSGRPTVEHVIANAVAKLRAALGNETAARIITQPRVGYRFTGTVERTAVGRAMTSSLEFRAGDNVPHRREFQLVSLRNSSRNSEVWLAHHVNTKERRIFKFAPDGERLSTLKREVTLYRLLNETLGERDDLVRILDWNFESPPFFLECEYGGESLNEWAEKDSTLKSFTVEQRLGLFLQVANVVTAAHDVGVLHKDLKPANVLIAPKPDSTWHIRLTDFGSGRVLDPQRIADLGITQLGLTVTAAVNQSDNTGTALYLAPELLAHQAPTIQSDVYALGIMLYQLIIADLRKPMVSGWERDIDDELLRDDIRAATEGNPAHRMNSVHVLIDRLTTLKSRHQHLQQERHAQSLAIQTRDALRRTQARRPWVMVAGIVLLMGLAISSWLYVRAIRVQHQLLIAQAQAQQQAARAEAVTAFLNNDVLGAADPFSGAITHQRTIKEAMTNAASDIDGKFAHDPITEATIRMTLGDIFIRMGDGAAAEIQWRRAIAVLSEAGPAARPSLLKSHYGLSQALLQKMELEKAATELANADRLRLQYNLNDTQTQLASHESWGNYFRITQQSDQAIPHLQQALQLLRAQPTPNLSDMDAVRMSLGDCYIDVNRPMDAEKLFHDLIEEIKRRRNPSELMLAVANRMYGQSFMYQHRYEAAEPLIEQSYQTIAAALGPTNQLTFDSLGVRCNLYSATQQLEKALRCEQDMYQVARAKWGEQQLLTLSVLASIGETQYALHRYTLAIRLLDTARTGLATVAGPHNPMTQIADYYLARNLLQLHRIDRVQAVTRLLDAKALEESEPGAPWALRLRLLRGMTLLAKGSCAEALPQLQSAAQLHADADPTDTIVQEAQQALHEASKKCSNHSPVKVSNRSL